MKKFLAVLCASLAFAFGFTACSNGSSDSEYWYNIEMGTLSKSSFEGLSIDQSQANTSNDANFAIYQTLRSNSTSQTTSVKESQLEETFAMTGMIDSMISGEIEKLKSLGNYIMIVDNDSTVIWYYAESAGNCTEPIQ